jgi:serine/threonine-protein kinase
LALALGSGDDEVAGSDTSPSGPAYRVRTVIAQGPGRTLYLAEETPARRLVTLDVTSSRGADAPAEFQERLRRLKQLVHPSIARVRDGRIIESGEFCVVADHVAGPRVDRYCHRQGLGPDDRAALFGRVCAAIAFAHGLDAPHGRLSAEAVVISGTDGAASPVVTLFGMWTDRVPSARDDLDALRVLAAHLGVGEVPAARAALGALCRPRTSR